MYDFLQTPRHSNKFTATAINKHNFVSWTGHSRQRGELCSAVPRLGFHSRNFTVRKGTADPACPPILSSDSGASSLGLTIPGEAVTHTKPWIVVKITSGKGGFGTGQRRREEEEWFSWAGGRTNARALWKHCTFLSTQMHKGPLYQLQNPPLCLPQELNSNSVPSTEQTKRQGG